MPFFICPNCGNRESSGDRTAGFSTRPKGCSKCGFGFVFELLDDYYPAPNAAFFVCDQEARVIAGLEHPRMVPIYEIGQAEGVLFIAMKLLEGGNLADRITGGPLPWAEVVRLSGEIAEAFPLAFSTISGHCKVLKYAGLVVTERQGTKIVYSLNTSALEEAVAAVLEIAGDRKPPKGKKP